MNTDNTDQNKNISSDTFTNILSKIAPIASTTITTLENIISSHKENEIKNQENFLKMKKEFFTKFKGYLTE